VVLGSASPRRRELLTYIATDIAFDSADINETPFKQEAANILVERLATSKAHAVAVRHKNALVIGSDTIVAINDTILGKPKDYTDFATMMAMLSNSQHQVYTGVCIINTQTGRIVKHVVVTQVDMGEISSASALDYWQTGEPEDKAGGYAIQGIGGQFVKSINGSISSVIGLPIYETKQLLQQAIE
jgi:septum formation protein